MAGGRPKGSTNHQSRLVKEMILAALDKKGGEEYFIRQADENPTAFMTLIGKVLPTQISGDAENPLTMALEVAFVRSQNRDS